MYYFDVTGTPPGLIYTYQHTFDIRINSGLNPFSASTGSPMVAPPAWIHALYISDDLVVAFAGDHVYDYTISDGHWTEKSLIPCPV